MDELIQDITRLIVAYRKPLDSKEWRADKSKEQMERREKIVRELTRIRSELEELI